MAAKESAMTYKTILVHLDRGPRSADRLELGFELADALDSHLVGLFALSSSSIPSYALAEAGALVRDAESRRRAESTKEAAAAFRIAASRHGRVRSEWRASSRDALDAMRVSARYSDLVILGQNDSDNDLSGVSRELVDDLVLSAGRPVLIVPYAGKFRRVGRRVLIAWNAGQEAARAVTDALPLLARAEAVEVTAFEPQTADHGDIPGADISLFLARHGVKVTAAQQRGEGIDVGSQILSRAADFDADLIVMGAYGHARLRQLVLGGVTRTLLESMTVPVLMSH
jgi:nucleotide-binding universal stress UspA family protein